MRGSPRGRRRGRNPGNPSTRGKQPRIYQTDAVLVPDSFMRAIAATEDRQNFDRLVSTPAQSQQTPSLQRATQQYWRPTRRVLEDELESTVNGSTTIDDVGVLHATSDSDDTLKDAGKEPKDTVDLLFEAVYDDSFPIPQQIRKDFGSEGLESFKDQQQMLGLWHGIILLLEVKVVEVRRWRDEGTLRQSIIQIHEGRGTSSHYFTWFKRNQDILQTPAWLAGGYKTKASGLPSAYTQGNFTGNKIPGSPGKAPLENSSNALSQPQKSSSALKPVNIDETSAFMGVVQAKTARGHQFGSPPKKAHVIGSNSRRYDIAELKRLQPVNGGSTLPIAKRAASQMQSLLSPQDDEPLISRPAVNIKHASHAVKDFLYQAQRTDYTDAGAETKIGKPNVSRSAIPTWTPQKGLTKITDDERLVAGDTSRATARLKNNVDLLGLDENATPDFDDGYVTKLSSSRTQTQHGTGNAWTSKRSNVPSRPQSVFPEDGSSTDGERRREVEFEKETASLNGNDNTLSKDETKNDEVRRRIIARVYTAIKDLDKTSSMPAAAAAERAAEEEDPHDSPTETGSGLKNIGEEDGTTGRVEVNTREQLVNQDGTSDKDVAQEGSKEVLVDPFKWLLPANFR